jgi:hypothetical protein
MAKWGIPSPKAELEELQGKYDSLLEDYKALQANVNCDFYEAYLLEKKMRQALEKKVNTKPHKNTITEEDVHQVAGFEYYSHE